jgi:hypothetical protein
MKAARCHYGKHNPRCLKCLKEKRACLWDGVTRTTAKKAKKTKKMKNRAPKEKAEEVFKLRDGSPESEEETTSIRSATGMSKPFLFRFRIAEFS